MWKYLEYLCCRLLCQQYNLPLRAVSAVSTYFSLFQDLICRGFDFILLFNLIKHRAKVSGWKAQVSILQFHVIHAIISRLHQLFQYSFY